MINEEDRLHTLRDLELLDTLPEEEYNQLVELASEICGTPISLVSLVDEHRQWFKAAKGITVAETHRNLSFCAHAIQQPDLFVVEDATKDLRFVDNELVTGSLGIRFYAGTPLQAPDGNSIGTLCVIDTVPRILTTSQRNALATLGRQVEVRVALRAKQKTLEAALADNERLTNSLCKSNDLFRAFMDHNPFMGYIKDAAGRFVFYNRKLSEHFGIAPGEWIDKTDADLFPPEFAETYREHDLQVLASDCAIEFDEVSRGAVDDELTYWRSCKFPFRQPDGELMLAGISMDVTESLQREAQLQRSLAEKNALALHLESSRSLFHAFADLSPYLTYLKTEDGRYIFYNRLYAERFGVSQTEWIGKCSYDMLPPELVESVRAVDQDVLASGKRVETENTRLEPDGTSRTYRSVKFTYCDADGQRMIAGIATEITEHVKREQALTEANRRLDQLATTDALTGIPNRRAFETALTTEFSNSIRRKRTLSVLLMDIDDFKRRNDQLGHGKGDEALQILASVLTRSGRMPDLPARVGGEEFAVLLPETDAAGAIAAARRIQALLAQEDAGPLPLTVSIGVACLNDTIQCWEQLVAAADTAMYEAKRSGKNCIVAHHDHVAKLMVGLSKDETPPLPLSMPKRDSHNAFTSAHRLKGRRKRSRVRL